MLRRIIALVSLSAVSSCCLALPSTPTGSCLRGRTVDTSGVAIRQSTVTVQAIEGDVSYTALSNSSGEFQVCLLPMGQYQVIAHRGGFEDSVHIETLGDGQNVSIDFQLQRSENGESKPAALTDLEKTTGVDLLKSNSGNLGGAASESIREFSIATDFSGAQNIPDAPSSSKTLTPHGQIYGFVGSNLVEPTDVTIGTQLPMFQFGASLGGTFDQGRSSYFVSYDQYGINRQRLLSNLANQVSVSNTGLSTNANGLTSSALVSRVDRQFSSRDSGYLRFDRDEMHGNSLQRGQDANLPSGAAGLNVVQQNVGAGNTVNLSPNTTNETQAQFVSTDVQVAAGAAATGLQSTLPTDRHNRVFEAANNVYRQVGSQSLRMGGDFLYNQMNISFMQTSLGRTAAIGPSLSQSAQDVGLYVLSQRQLRPNLLVTTGVRYDAESMRGFQTDRNNFSPQVGFAWSPGSYGTVLRAGFGMTYDRVPFPAFAGSTDPSGVANLNLSTKIYNPGGTSLGALRPSRQSARPFRTHMLNLPVWRLNSRSGAKAFFPRNTSMFVEFSWRFRYIARRHCARRQLVAMLKTNSPVNRSGRELCLRTTASLLLSHSNQCAGGTTRFHTPTRRLKARETAPTHRISMIRCEEFLLRECCILLSIPAKRYGSA